MPKATTAPARLQRLLPWLNGDLDTDVSGPRGRPEDGYTHTDYAEVRNAIGDFVRSFDGSAGAGHLEVSEHKSRKPLTDEELSGLDTALRIMLEQGFGDPTLADLSFPASSLRFAVRSAGRRKPGWRDSRKGTHVVEGGAEALRDYRAAGAYVLQVQGPTVDLVPFLVAHLLTQPEMVAVRRCERSGCERFLITATAARGRPQTFCSASCRVRNAEQLQQRRDRSRTRRRAR